MADKKSEKQTIKSSDVATVDAATLVKPETGPSALVTYDYGDDAGAGYEGQTAADTTLPFMVQLQALSPLVVEGREGCRPGAWLNTVTQQVYDKDRGFLFVPATTRHRFAIWTASRDEGGKFAGHKEPDDAEILKAVQAAEKYGKNVLPNGHLARETFYVYGVVCSDAGHAEGMALIAFVSTKIKSYKTWMTRVQQVRVPNGRGGMTRPPLYGHLTRIASAAKQDGNKHWFVPEIRAADPRGLVQSLLEPSDERFLMAKACRQLVDSGEAKVDFERQDQGGDGGEEAGSGGSTRAFQ